MTCREHFGGRPRTTDAPGAAAFDSRRRAFPRAHRGDGRQPDGLKLEGDQCRLAVAATATRVYRVALCVACVLAAVLPLALAPRARAAHDWAPIEHHWTFDNPGCTGEIVDPITLIMFGDPISAVDVRDMVQYHTGWGSSRGGSGGQWSIIYAVGCNETDENNASSDFHSDRYHARWNFGGGPKYPAYAAGRYVSSATRVVLGTPHYEIGDETCGETLWLDHHRAVDYAGARNRILTDMSTHHPYEWVWYGNTEPSPQCGNTSIAQSDGWAAYVFTWPVNNPPSGGFDPPMDDTTH